MFSLLYVVNSFYDSVDSRRFSDKESHEREEIGSLKWLRLE